MLAELSTKEISEVVQPDSFDEHKTLARQGGTIARNARLELEERTGKAVVSPQNAKLKIQQNEQKSIDTDE